MTLMKRMKWLRTAETMAMTYDDSGGCEQRRSPEGLGQTGQHPGQALALPLSG